MVKQGITFSSNSPEAPGLLLGGFSLFVADLAYDAESLTDQAKVGIFAGSLISAVAGSLVLRSGRRLTRREQELPTG